MRSTPVGLAPAPVDHRPSVTPGNVVSALDRAASVDPARSTHEAVQSNGARSLLIASVWGGAALHGAAIPDHLDHWPLAAAFFALLVLVGVLLGIVLAGSWRPATAARATVITSAVTIGVWAMSRGAGLPFGPDPGMPEAMGVMDVAAMTLQMAAIGFSVQVLRANGRRTRWDRPVPMKVALAGLAVVTTLGMSAAGAHAVQSEHGHPGGVSTSQ